MHLVMRRKRRIPLKRGVCETPYFFRGSSAGLT
jgi:hypothetical protein